MIYNQDKQLKLVLLMVLFLKKIHYNLVLNLATATTPLEVEGINIHMPIDNTISETTITIEYIDQDGITQTMDVSFVSNKNENYF